MATPGGFETYLESIGYVRHVFNFNKEVWEIDKDEYHAYSSYGPLIYTYIKGKTRIQYGLGEKGFPPGLTHPIPHCREMIDSMKSKENGYCDDWIRTGAAYAGRLFTVFSFAEVEEAIRLNLDLVYDAVATPA